MRGGKMSSSAISTAAPKRNRVLDLIIKYPILPTLVCFICMVILFIILSPRSRTGEIIFLTPINLVNIVEATAGFSIGAFAMTLVLLVGCTDLSTESIIALCCVTLGQCLGVFKMNFWLSVLITLLVGALCGALNAILVVKFNVPSFLATIAFAFVFTGMAYKICDARTVSLTAPMLPMLVRIFGSMGSGAAFLGIPVLLWWTGLLLVGMYLLISKSKFGRWAQATGGNIQAAFSSGVNIDMVRAVALILMGVFCAIVALIFCARLGSASASYGAGYGLKFIICAVLGGTTFTGDGGNVFGSLLGSLLMGTMTNGLGILGVDTYSQQIIVGIVIVAAVVFSIYVSSKK